MCVYGYKGRRILGRARRRGVKQDLRGAVLAHHILESLAHRVKQVDPREACNRETEGWSVKRQGFHVTWALGG